MTSLNNSIDVLTWLISREIEGPLAYLSGLVLLSILPLVGLCLTSFVKLSVVFAALRSALGSSGIPSQTISSLLALILSLHMLGPVYQNFQAKLKENPIQIENDLQVAASLLSSGKEVLSEHLRANSSEREREFFIQFGRDKAEIGSCNSTSVCKEAGESFWDLLSAFILTELDEAFRMAVMLFLPFLIIDLVVASLLMAMGMIMVSPTNISLPLKLGVFVISDGWLELCSSLIGAYSS